MLRKRNTGHRYDSIIYSYPSTQAKNNNKSSIIQYLIHRRKCIKKKDEGRACFRFYSSSSVQTEVYINTYVPLLITHTGTTRMEEGSTVADEKTTDTTACALHTAVTGHSFTAFSRCSSQIRHSFFFLPRFILYFTLFT